jgi:hypothetical protein
MSDLLHGQSNSYLRAFARSVWDGFTGVFRSVQRTIALVLPEEFAWAIIYLFLWMAFVSLAVWVVSP